MAVWSRVIPMNWYGARRRRQLALDARGLARRAVRAAAVVGVLVSVAVVCALMQGWRFSRARRGPFDER